MATNLADRFLTVVVTATLTSAAWIVVGSTYVGKDAGEAAPTSRATPAAAETTPAATPTVAATAAPQADGPLTVPVAGIARSQLSDSFNDSRGGGRLHEALDIMAPTGTPVLAAAAGRVEKLFRSDAGGNTIYVRSPDRRTLYYYAHLDAYAPDLREGQQVERGKRLGTVGATGNANPAAPHLHFAVMRTAPDAAWWEPATALNPYPLLTAEQTSGNQLN
jgi:murein DD-endopeptidase MepM/ murein hydrolase activator NlpD